ncbi:hypothetical protein CNMCM8694_008767 [Aspergillus lentulus]|nr:hypothetical protein CNMCM8060_006568 [Aspergillus lentulus]KAF4181654.1 hypothetical protein CNMCM7927_000533 [Aspergillus lentulus]KAF4198721.1 hypothetical protein CNMCM8694_008767 [Aspergillus lentulus]
MSGKEKEKPHIGPWQLGRILGEGVSSQVRLANHAVTGQMAAIKIMSKKSAAIKQREQIATLGQTAWDSSSTGARQIPGGIEREAVIMKVIAHPNIVSLYDVWESHGELYLVLEYMQGGELFDYVSNNGPLPEEEAVRLFRQIIAGIGYCHQLNIYHRDLKLENILLDACRNVKLADFGLAAPQPTGHRFNTLCGSPNYVPPELIHERKYRGDKADIWSCGVILYALLTGYLPFNGGDTLSTLLLVKKGDYTIPPQLSDESADLIQRILQKRPEDRISMHHMGSHPLLKKYEKLHPAMSSYYVGPPPPLSQDCGPPISEQQAIDVDLLRNLQILWHDMESELTYCALDGSRQCWLRLLSYSITRALTSYTYANQLNLRPNHERLFYCALMKFRDEHSRQSPAQPTVACGARATIKTCIEVATVCDPNIIWKDEIEKVSHELRQTCEDAFNKGPLSTGYTTTTYTDTGAPATLASVVTPTAKASSSWVSRLGRRTGALAMRIGGILTEKRVETGDSGGRQTDLFQQADPSAA